MCEIFLLEHVLFCLGKQTRKEPFFSTKKEIIKNTNLYNLSSASLPHVTRCTEQQIIRTEEEGHRSFCLSKKQAKNLQKNLQKTAKKK